MNNREKRRARRDRHDSVIEILGAAGKLLDSGRLVDYSNTGASFFSRKTMPQGAKLKLRVRLLEQGVLDISARIVWARKEGVGNLYGIKFDSVQQVSPAWEFKNLR